MTRKIPRILTSLLLILSLILQNFLFLVNPVYAASSPWTQTDWSGGVGASTTNQYSAASSTDATTTSGQVTLTNTEKFSNTGFESDLTSWNTGAQPSSISGLQLWLKADAITGLNDGDLVTTWTDSSGNSNNATQATIANKPTYKTNIINSKPVIRFDGTDYLGGTFGSNLSISDLTMFTVHNRTSNNNIWNMIMFLGPINGNSTTAGGVPHLGQRNNTTQFGFHNAWVVDAGVFVDQGGSALNTWWVSSLIRSGSGTTGNGGSITVRSNSLSSSGTQSWDSTATNQFTVAAQSNQGGGLPLPMIGDIPEIIIYNNALSDANRSRIENYLRDKYNITVSSGITSVTRDTTIKYAGSASAKLITSSSDTGEFTQSVNVGDTNTYNLSAYARTDGTAVTSSDVSLFYNGSTISTTYTSVGSGWYQLTGTITDANASRVYGVQVKANKTVYVDNMSLNSYASSGTLTSSIFDSGFTAGAAWGTLTYNATTPVNTSVSVKARTSNSSSMTGATAFSSCTAITSASDISSNSCVTDSHRYIQYQLSLANTDSVSTPTFQDVSIAFATYDATAPTISLTALATDPNSDTTPTLSGTATDSIGTVSNVQFQMDSTSGSWTACTATDGSFNSSSEAFSCTAATLTDQTNGILSHYVI